MTYDEWKSTDQQDADDQETLSDDDGIETNMSNECRFGLTEQPCVDCGKPTYQLGTCADRIHCDACKEKFLAMDGDFRETLIKMAEEAPYWDTMTNEDERE